MGSRVVPGGIFVGGDDAEAGADRAQQLGMEIMVGTMMRHRQCGDLFQELPILIEKGRPAALLLEGGISGAEPCDPSKFVRMPLAIVALAPALLASSRSCRPRIEAERGKIKDFPIGSSGL